MGIGGVKPHPVPSRIKSEMVEHLGRGGQLDRVPLAGVGKVQAPSSEPPRLDVHRQIPRSDQILSTDRASQHRPASVLSALFRLSSASRRQRFAQRSCCESSSSHNDNTSAAAPPVPSYSLKEQCTCDEHIVSWTCGLGVLRRKKSTFGTCRDVRTPAESAQSNTLFQEKVGPQGKDRSALNQKRFRERFREPSILHRQSGPPGVTCWEGATERVGTTYAPAPEGVVSKPGCVETGRKKRSPATRIVIPRAPETAEVAGVVGERQCIRSTLGPHNRGPAQDRRRRDKAGEMRKQGMGEHNSSVVLLPIPAGKHTAECESLSVSSANSTVAHELSASSLPPMGTTGTFAADLVVEEASFDESAASSSLSVASSSDKADLALVERANGNGGVASDVTSSRRGRGTAGFRQCSGSLGACTRNKSACTWDEDSKSTTRKGWPRGKDMLRKRDSRIDGQVLDVQELSGSDEESLDDTLVAGNSSSRVDVPWASVSPAATAVDLGHKRAALELRNLKLEREVEQLKKHLQSMDGDVLRRESREFGRRRRPLPHRLGERIPVGRAAGHDPPAANADRAARGRSACAAMATFSGNHRSAKVLLASEKKIPRNVPRRDRSVSSAEGSIDGQDRSHANGIVRGGRRSQLQSGVRGRQTGSRQGESTRDDPEDNVPQDPPRSSRSREIDQPFAGHPRSGADAGSTILPTTSGPCSASSFVSPARTLRNAGPRSPEGNTEPAAAVNEWACASTRRQAVSPAPVVTSRATERAQAQELPQLCAHETDRQRRLPEKRRSGRSSTRLTGVVSGLKNAFLGRRRSTGDTTSVPHASLASGSGSSCPSDTPSRRRGERAREGRRGSDDILTLASQIVAGSKSDHAPISGEAKVEGATLDELQEHTGCRESSAKQSASTHPSSATDTLATVEAAAAAIPTTAYEQQSARQSDQHAEGSACRREARTVVVKPLAVQEEERDSTIAPGVTPARRETLVAEKNCDWSGSVHPESEGSPQEEGKVIASSIAARSNPGTGHMLAGAGTDVVVTEEAPVNGRWPAALDARWAEVEFMLCCPIEDEESLRYTHEATKAGLVFMDKLERKAQELGVLKGQLSRWLLPYDADTFVEKQQAATPRRFKESLQAFSASCDGEADALTEEEARYLMAGARRVRQLVRVKIADDNDLNTAKEALVTMAGFFASICEEASRRGGTASGFDILQERRAISPITRPPAISGTPRVGADPSVLGGETRNDGRAKMGVEHSEALTPRVTSQPGPGQKEAATAAPTYISASSDTSTTVASRHRTDYKHERAKSIQQVAETGGSTCRSPAMIASAMEPAAPLTPTTIATAAAAAAAAEPAEASSPMPHQSVPPPARATLSGSAQGAGTAGSIVNGANTSTSTCASASCTASAPSSRVALSRTLKSSQVSGVRSEALVVQNHLRRASNVMVDAFVGAHEGQTRDSVDGDNGSRRSTTKSPAVAPLNSSAGRQPRSAAATSTWVSTLPDQAPPLESGVDRAVAPPGSLERLKRRRRKT